jgi:cystathionine beta-lyase/cystathionine gamma-synthase
MEGSKRALATASGMLGIFALPYHLPQAGEEIVTSHMTYDEVYRLFFRLAPEPVGITPRFVEDPSDLEQALEKL